jgi:phosphonopyruvate decarboxylase
LDGDGSLLMNLGTLVTIAGARRRNLFHCNNGCYEANRSRHLPAAEQVDFVAIASAARIHHVFNFDEIATFEAELPHLLVLQGPVFVNLRVVDGEPSPQDYVYIHSESARTAFREALATTPASPDSEQTR